MPKTTQAYKPMRTII